MFKIENMHEDLVAICQAEKLFDFYRIVNPFTHEVYDYSTNKDLVKMPDKCYKIWGRVNPCQNCVSKRACTEGKQFVKIEYLDSKCLLVMVLPISINNKLLSLELIGNVTESMTVSNNVSHDQSEIAQIITEFNDLAIKDSFTGLYNKVFITNEINNLIENGKPFSIIAIDIDNFKHANDSYGHVFGDLALIKISNMLKEFSTIHNAKAARMGGDEFLIQLPQTDKNGIASLCEKLCQDITNCDIEKDVDETITISYGISIYKDGLTCNQIIDIADKKMYQQKRNKIK